MLSALTETMWVYYRCPTVTVAKICWCLSKRDASPLCLFHSQALNKKEHRGCDSPDADASYVLTPNTEEKYKKINEEFDNMMKSHKIVSCSLLSLFISSIFLHMYDTVWWSSHPLQSTVLPQQNFMHVTPGSMSYSSSAGGGGGGATSQALAAATAALADSGILSSPHTHLHRNINSPQRPPSTGNAGVCVYVCALSVSGLKLSENMQRCWKSTN